MQTFVRPTATPKPSWSIAIGALVFTTGILLASTSWAEAPGRVAADPAWTALTSGQKTALRPLAGEWASLDATQRSRWIAIANRFSTLPPEEQARIRARMAAWTRLTPRERGEVRQNFTEAQVTPAEDRKAKWEAYQALSPERRKELAARAAPPAGNKSEAKPKTSSPPGNAKSNIVPNSSYAARPKPVAPGVAQARPGATTNLISQRPSPPVHEQTGLPKIAATPGFVDETTLLPKRGPQGVAATRSTPASTRP